MKIIQFSYRWLPRTVWKNLSGVYYDFKNGIKNLYIFFEAVWWFRSWDWSGMLALLEVSAREMRKCQEHAIHVGSERDARQLLIVETLCKRLQADDYFEQAGYGEDWDTLPDYTRTKIARHAGYMAKQDAVYLGRVMRFVQNWWS